MGKFRILKNKDHCLIQKKGWFFWKYVYSIWNDECSYCLFKRYAQEYSSIKYAENGILRIKEIDKANRKKNGKYEVIKPKVDSPLYNALNDEEE